MKNKNIRRVVAIWYLTAFYRAQMLLIPSKKLEKRWGKRGEESPADDTPWNYKYAYDVSTDVNRIAGKTPWKSKCLVRALTVRYFVRRKGITSTMYLGVGKDENGKMIAHSWLRCGKLYATGGNGDGYGIVAKFCL